MDKAWMKAEALRKLNDLKQKHRELVNEYVSAEEKTHANRNKRTYLLNDMRLLKLVLELLDGYKFNEVNDTDAETAFERLVK